MTNDKDILKDDLILPEDMQRFVTSRYPDAFARKYASLSMVIWCPLLNCRLSGFFHSNNEAWADAVEWIKRKEGQRKTEDADFEILPPKHIEQ